MLKQSLQQNQSLVMTQAMQQAFAILQMQTVELEAWLEEEAMHNPLLSYERPGGEMLCEFASLPSLYEELMRLTQIHLGDTAIAQRVIGLIDERGLITDPLTKEEESVLLEIQAFAPPGIGARSVQESLLLQLLDRGRRGSRAWNIIANRYDDFLKGKISDKELTSLDPFPGYRFHRGETVIAKPDLIFEEEELDLNQPHVDIINYPKGETKEDRQYMRRQLAGAKWLLHALDKRKKTLSKIASFLLRTQREFLFGESAIPKPMTIREAAKELAMSESTLSRAISNKTIAMPQKIFSLRECFTAAITTTSGQKVSNALAKHLLLSLIEHEKAPLSDATLSMRLREMGIPCARRTVAKYRAQLGIASARARYK